mmetsp:Transcript_130625/g.325958  ORF Transcript_130625/g.325958 Transcript_130625/m.325958 type:complete len:348 (+) Transcript_130625:114-1157(+)
MACEREMSAAATAAHEAVGREHESPADVEAGPLGDQAADEEVEDEPQVEAVEVEDEGPDSEVDPVQQLAHLEHKHSRQTCYFVYVYTVEILLRCSILVADGAIFQDFTGGNPCTRRDTRAVCSVPLVASRVGFAVVFSFILFFQTMVLAGIVLASSRIKKTGLPDLSADCQKMLIVLQLLTLVSFSGYTVRTVVTWKESSQRTQQLSIAIVFLSFLTCFYNERTRHLCRRIRRAFSDLRDSHDRVIRRHELERNLPSVPVSRLRVTGEQERECTICLETFQPDDMATELPCGHTFHTSCICEWLSDARHSKCPLRCSQDPLPQSLTACSQVPPDIIGDTSSSAERRS